MATFLQALNTADPRPADPRPNFALCVDGTDAVRDVLASHCRKHLCVDGVA